MQNVDPSPHRHPDTGVSIRSPYRQIQKESHPPVYLCPGFCYLNSAPNSFVPHTSFGLSPRAHHSCPESTTHAPHFNCSDPRKLLQKMRASLRIKGRDGRPPLKPSLRPNFVLQYLPPNHTSRPAPSHLAPPLLFFSFSSRTRPLAT